MGERKLRDEERVKLEKALAHPLRAELLARLSDAPNCAADLARSLGESRQKVNYHITKLLALDCIEQIDEVEVRGAYKKIYMAKEKMLIGPETWKELMLSSRHGISLNIIREATTRLQAALREGTFDARDDRIAGNWKLRLDEEGWKEAWQMLAEFIDRLEEMQDEAIERTPDHMERTPYTYSLFAFESPRKNNGPMNEKGPSVGEEGPSR